VTGCATPGVRELGSGTSTGRQTFLEFAPLPTAVASARGHTINVLAEWGLRELADDAALVVSELVTNAVAESAKLAGRPPVALRLVADGEHLIIEAWDCSPAEVDASGTGDLSDSGRGLTIVAALSRRWGSRRTGYRRKVVWAECALEAPDCIPGSAGRDLEDIPGSMALPGAERQEGP
jgi:anti-sigma regulatory factor (Ser/Thr protein kinase)